MVIQEVLKKPCTPYLARGLRHETTNVLTSQGFCTAFGFPVPTPFFLQQLLNGPYIDNDIALNVTHRGRFTAILISAEVLPEENEFCNHITDGFGNWWTKADAAFPSFDELSECYLTMMNKLADQGIISTRRAIDDADLLKIFKTIIGVKADNGKSTAEKSQAKVEGNVDVSWSTKSSDAADLDGGLQLLANAIGMPVSDNSDLTSTEKGLLKALDELTMMDTRLKQLSAVEAEEVEAESWNLDVLQHLIELSQKLGRIPFPSAQDIYNLVPSHASGTTGKNIQVFDVDNTVVSKEKEIADRQYSSSSKGKAKAQPSDSDAHVNRRLFNLHPRDAEVTWWSASHDASGDPYPRMRPLETIASFTELLGDLQPEILQSNDHFCPFRTLLTHVLKSEVRDRMTTVMTGRMNDPTFQSNFVADPAGSRQHSTNDISNDGDTAQQLPKWPIQSPPPSSDNESDESNESSSSASAFSSAAGSHSDTENVVLDVDKVHVTFSTSNTI